MVQISDLGFSLNRADISLQYNSAFSEDVLDTVFPYTDEVDVDSESSVATESISGDKISSLNVEKLEAGTISSKAITLDVVDGAGDVYFAAGKTDFTTTETGFILGIDDSDGNKAKFYIGDTTSYISWDGTTLSIVGGLDVSEINIPDEDTTADSFHVETDGDTWWGCTHTNFTADNDNATAYVLKSGKAKFQDVETKGTIHGSVFKYDVASAVGGQLIVTNADKISTAMTALDASTLTIEGNTTFAANDMLYIRADNGSGIQEEYMRVTSAASAPTYTVTRDLAGAYGANANPAWKAGTAVMKIGESDGAAAYSGGWLRLYGEGTNAPYYSVYSRTGVAHDGYAERVRVGNLNGIADFVADAYGIFAGDYANHQYMSYDDVSGQLRVNDATLELRSFYGNGVDGDATISVDTSLATDMFYDDLTINDGITLNPNGYRVFVKGTLNLSTSGKVARSGNAGTNGGNGGDGNAMAGSGTGGLGGTAGAAGAALAVGSLPGSVTGVIGKAGAGGKGTPTDTTGGAGTAGDAGTNNSRCIITTASAGSAGGNGGNATSVGTSTGGTGGVLGAAGTNTATLTNRPFALIPAYTLYDFVAGATINSAPGNGGSGSGASGGVRYSGANEAASGGGGGSGGSGSGGGVVEVFARRIIGTGTIEANGGNGGNGGNAGLGDFYDDSGGWAYGGSGGGAGGAGGDGGVVIVAYNYKASGVTIQANGGTGGTKGNKSAGGAGVGGSATDGTDGTVGTDGVAGVVIELQN